MFLEHYAYAGLDFVIDQNNQAWFIEANYNPMGVFKAKKVNKKEKILKEFSKIISKYKTPCMIIQKGNSKYQKRTRRIGKTLNEYSKINLCYEHENTKNRKYLINTKKEKIIPDLIFRGDCKINKVFEKNNIKIINTRFLEKIVNNKSLTQKIIEKDKKIKIPKSYIVKNKTEIKKHLKKKEFNDGFVIKPNNQTEGLGVHIFNKNSKIPKISSKKILQQRIIQKKKNNKYWDVRVFVINGKYVGGFIRASKLRVTNISKGAVPRKIPPKIDKILKLPAEQVTKTIEKYCKKNC